MSKLLERRPYGPRDDLQFMREINDLTHHHLEGCPAYRRVWPEYRAAATLAEVPFLQAGVFKYFEFKTIAQGIRHERTLKSSATTTGIASRISLDEKSTKLQSRSTAAILTEFLGAEQRPLLVLDNSRSLLAPAEISARVAAAVSLRPLASDIAFLLDEADNPQSMNWPRLLSFLERHDELMIYGFTSMMWLAWGAQAKPEGISRLLHGKRLRLIHSGGWKKVEAAGVTREQFERALLQGLGAGSTVLDFYGLVEQAGLIYPLCQAGFRHTPGWAAVLVRDPITMEPSPDGDVGVLQLFNTLALGAPYHSVVTEDLGRILRGACACGRRGTRFELLGRVPRSEARGCANV